MSLSNSTARTVLATTLAAALLAGSGCSMFHHHHSDDQAHGTLLHRKDGSLRFLPHRNNADYAKSEENRPLEIPPDLDTPATDPAMQIPAVSGSNSGMADSGSAASSDGSFSVSDTAAGTWDRLGKALDRIDGVTVTQRAQVLNSYDVQYKGQTMLLRATSNGTSTRIDAVGADGKSLRTPETIQLLNLLRNRIG